MSNLKRAHQSDGEGGRDSKLNKLAKVAAATAAAEAAEAEAIAQQAAAAASGSSPESISSSLNNPAILNEELPLFLGVIPDAGRKVVVGFVGLPARGKSYLARKLAYYLNWMGVTTKIFNHGDYRRKHLGESQSAAFFRPDNSEGTQLRMSLARLALRDLLNFMSEGNGRVGIMDATNSSVQRRRMVERECGRLGVQVFWVESICDRDSVIDDNIYKVKVHLPEYAHMSKNEIVEDFKKRIAFYEQAYTTLESGGEEDASSFMKIYNLGDDFSIHRPKGALVMRIVRFLMCVHTRPRSIYLSRHGESMYNKAGKIGGDSGLTPAGIKYSWELNSFMKKQKKDGAPTKFKVWTSSLKRTIQTAALFDEDIQSFKSLDELNAGECEGSTYNEIKERHPQLYESRALNKYYYRYPRGESYRDLVLRIEPLLLEIEREEDLLIVSHQAVARCLLAYFKNIPQNDLSKELPYLEVPLHTVLKVDPGCFECQIDRFHLGPDAVNTQQSRPESIEPSAQPEHREQVSTQGIPEEKAMEKAD